MAKKTMSRLIVLSTVILLLLAALATKDIMARLFGPKPGKPFSAIKKDSVSEITLTNEQARSRIYRKSARWYVTEKGFEYPADQERVNGLMDSMIAFLEGDPVSTNKARHKELGIAKNSIVLKEGDTTYTLYIGDATGTVSNYVRVDNENNIYVAQGFDTALTSLDYRDLSLNAVSDESKVTAVHISYDGAETNLSKNKESWKVNDTAARREKVDYYINDIKTLKITDRVQDSELAAGTPEALSLRVREGNSEKNLRFFAKDDSSYFLRLDKGPLYTIQAAFVESLKKTQGDFTP